MDDPTANQFIGRTRQFERPSWDNPIYRHATDIDLRFAQDDWDFADQLRREQEGHRPISAPDHPTYDDAA